MNMQSGLPSTSPQRPDLTAAAGLLLGEGGLLFALTASWASGCQVIPNVLPGLVDMMPACTQRAVHVRLRSGAGVQGRDAGRA
jgi:hypothetical protein